MMNEEKYWKFKGADAMGIIIDAPNANLAAQYLNEALELHPDESYIAEDFEELD